MNKSEREQLAAEFALALISDTKLDVDRRTVLGKELMTLARQFLVKREDSSQ